MLDLVRNPKGRFSCDKAHFEDGQELITRYFGLDITRVPIFAWQRTVNLLTMSYCMFSELVSCLTTP